MSVTGFPSLGTIKYNGYTFEGATHVAVDAEPVYDPANVTVTAHKHTITVQAIVANSGGLDNTLEEIRRKLLAAGAPFEFVDHGFGDDIIVRGLTAGGVNSGTTVDVDAGPKPQLLSWRPIVEDKAARIEWRIVVTIPSCAHGKPRQRGVKSINYTVDWDINEHGLTTRTISGELSIVQNRHRAGRLADTADRYRSKIRIAPVVGFKRAKTYSVSADKSVLSFTVTDSEIPSDNRYPPDVTDIRASHRVSLGFAAEGNAGGQLRRNSTIAATITVAPGRHGSYAWAVFSQMVRSRLQHSINRRKTPWLQSLDIEEDIFGRTHSFAASYWYAGLIQDYLRDTGLWLPVQTGDWTRWHASLGNDAFHQRGYAKMGDHVYDSVIVNLCSGADSIAPNNIRSTTAVHSNYIPPSGGIGSPGPLDPDPPSSDRSWLKYEMHVMPTEERPVVRQSHLQGPGPRRLGWNPETEDPPNEFVMSGSPSAGVLPDRIQEAGAPRTSVRFVGEASRVGFPVPRPRIDSVGGKVAYPVKSDFWVWVTESINPLVPIFHTRWVLDYVVDSSPGKVEPPRTPDKLK